MTSHILIVEDDAPILTLFSKLLQNANYQTDCVSNGEQALDFLQKQNPDLVLLDLALPGINGLEVLQYIQQEPRLDGTKVAVISAHPQISADVYSNRVNKVITKPIRPTSLLQTIENLIGQ